MTDLGTLYEPGSRTASHPRGGVPTISSLTTATDRRWAGVAHLSAFVAAWLALGFLGPLAVLIVAGRRSEFVRRHAVEAVNFNLSFMIYGTVAWALTAVLIGFVMLVPIGLIYLVSTLLAAGAAHHGRSFRDPMTFRFLH